MAFNPAQVLKRPLLATLLLVMSAQFQLVNQGVIRWSVHFWAHRMQIVELTVVNAAITTGMEYSSRTLGHGLLGKDDEQAFLVPDGLGGHRLHRQSLINILMSIVGSILGGPAYFFNRRGLRFAFFVGFGILNSFIGQGLACIILSDVFILEGRRVFFDLFYSGTFKFGIFEFLRGPIVRSHGKVFRLAFFRFNHKFWTTFFKVQLIDWLGMRS